MNRWHAVASPPLQDHVAAKVEKEAAAKAAAEAEAKAAAKAEKEAAAKAEGKELAEEEEEAAEEKKDEVGWPAQGLALGLPALPGRTLLVVRLAVPLAEQAFGVSRPGPKPTTTRPRSTCWLQVDHVAEALKTYSIIQENQWNKGEM